MRPKINDILADEILLHIFSYLTEIDRFRVLPVCKLWNMMCKDRTLYHIQPHINSKQAFLKCCCSNYVLSFDSVVDRIMREFCFYWDEIYALYSLWVEGMKIACKYGHASLLKKILKLDPKDGFIDCLYVAVEKGYMSIVRQLMEFHSYSRMTKEKAYRIYANTDEMKLLLYNSMDIPR
jgi:hypothetical protein